MQICKYAIQRDWLVVFARLLLPFLKIDATLTKDQLSISVYNQNNCINPFVNNEGFSAENNLVHILGNNDDNEEDQVTSQVKLSTYLDTHELSDKLYQAKSKLSILKT